MKPERCVVDTHVWIWLIVATARDLGLPLITRDRKILAYAAEGHLQAIAA